MSSGDAGGPTAGPGRKTVGGFAVLAKLGQGALGAVLKARQVAMDRTVALKSLPPRLASGRRFLERLVREARAAAKLSHPSTVQGCGTGLADGCRCFAMEEL